MSTEQKKLEQLMTDSGDRFLDLLPEIAAKDAAGLKKAAQSYGNSWKSRGGVGAFMMLARKWDRLENQLKRKPIAVFDADYGSIDTVVEGNSYDIFNHIAVDPRSEGVIDDIRDLRRYLMLVEAEMVARGFGAEHRDNKADLPLNAGATSGLTT